MKYLYHSALLFLLALIILSPLSIQAEEVAKKDEVFSLDQCIEIALKNQPTIIAALGTIDVNRSRIGQAESNYYPQINLLSGYSRVKGASGYSSFDGTNSSSNNNPFNQYSASATLSQMIYDFGKTPAQVDIQKLTYNSARSDMQNVSEIVIFNVKQAYFNSLQAKRNRDVAEEAVSQFKHHLDQAKGFYEVGIRPKFDVTKADVDLSNAKLALIQAENAIKLARVTLHNAMGLTGIPGYSLVDILDFKKYTITYENALQKAYANRPDLQSAIAKRQAAEKTIDLAVTGYYPTLTGDANYNWTGQDFPLQKGWNFGVTLNIPLFTGFLTKYQVEEARANLNVLKANEELLRQQILLDVQQALLNLHEAEESIAVSEIAVRQATENLELANGRYTAGVGNPIEVTDSQVAYSKAKVVYNQALHNYKVSQAAIEKAMGTR